MENRDDAHRELKAAARSHRSPNGEIQARLTASVRPDASDVAALLARIRQRHEAVGPADLSEAALPMLRDAGRP